MNADAKHIPVGLIGYGYGGRVFHAPLIRAVAALDLRSIVTSRTAEVARIPGATAVASVAELLADPAIELVVVASPSDTHFEIAHQALTEGKHVVVDKPFTLTAHESEMLIHLAKRNGRLLSVFQNRRWDGDFLTATRLITGGALGNVYHYEAHYDRFRVQVRPVWREQGGPGSGILYDLGSHLIDQALQLFGMPRAIMADTLLQRPGAKSIDYFHLLLDYGSMRAILHAGMVAPGPGPHFIVHGDGGSFVKYGMDPQEEALKGGGTPADPNWGADAPSNYGVLTTAEGARRIIETDHGAYESYYAAIAESILKHTPPPVDPAEARDVIRVIEAAQESSAARAWMRLD